jgi:hypothetical protein
LDRPVGVRPPGANGGTSLIFLSLDRLGPSRVDRAGPWTARVWTDPDRLQNTSALLVILAIYLLHIDYTYITYYRLMYIDM